MFYELSKCILAKVKVNLTKEFFVEYFLKFGISTFDVARKQGVSEEVIDKLCKEKIELEKEWLKTKNISVFPGIRETLEVLYGKILMAIVTTSKRDNLKTKLQRTKLEKYFNFWITREDFKNEKPDPEPYLLAVKKSGLKPKECLAIEDNEKGIYAAKKAGLICYDLPNELSKNMKFSMADKILKNPKEIISVII